MDATRPLPACVPGAVLGYAPRSAARRVWRWVRPGSAGFFLLMLALAAGATWITWGTWKWMLQRDRQAFQASTMPAVGGSPGDFAFVHAPSRGALRHMARLPGTHVIELC